MTSLSEHLKWEMAKDEAMLTLQTENEQLKGKLKFAEETLDKIKEALRNERCLLSGQWGTSCIQEMRVVEFCVVCEIRNLLHPEPSDSDLDEHDR